MDKISKYNLSFEYDDCVLWFNSLTNSFLKLSKKEAETILELMNDLPKFEELYRSLYNNLKKSGFIIDADKDELSLIRFIHKSLIFSERRRHVTINPTLDCNLRCWYCSTEYAKAIHSGCMAPETVEAVKLHLKQVITESQIKEFHLDWFGGEPLMYFNQIVYPIGKLAKELCEDNNVVFTQHATTNSVYMTDDMMEKMAEIGFTSFQIPIDGNRKHHNCIKSNDDGSGTFDAIVNNINELPKFIPNVRITLRINYDRKSLYGIEDLLPLIQDDVKKNISVDFQKVWQVKCDDRDRERLSIVKKLFAENGLVSGYWAYHPGKFYRCYSDKRHHYAINYTGEIFKCTAQDYGKDKVIGNLNPDGKISWNYDLLSKLYSTDSFENERCLQCKALPMCMGPCIIRNYEARMKVDKMPPCLFKNVEYSLSEYVREQAIRRHLL